MKTTLTLSVVSIHVGASGTTVQLSNGAGMFGSTHQNATLSLGRDCEAAAPLAALEYDDKLTVTIEHAEP